MINKLQISGFKSLDNVEIEFGSITLLVGKNSSGKSSIIQSILLAIQNHFSTEDSNVLNGPLVSVGKFSEISNIYTNAKEIIFTFNDTSKMCLKEGQNSFEYSDFSDDLSDYLDVTHVKYLSSNRTGAKDIYQELFENNYNIDSLGEASIQYFEEHKNDPLNNENLIYDKTLSKTLDSQVNYWLEEIIGTRIQTEAIEQADINIAKYQIKDSILYARPKNVGSGTSFIISILIKVLSTSPHDTIIIENPEIHLHPKAQAKIIEFLIFASNNGVNIILETHSDHIFNGLRKAMKKEKLSPQSAKVYFTELTDNGTTVQSVEFSNDGKIKSKINGLFDQFNLDLNELLGL